MSGIELVMRGEEEGRAVVTRVMRVEVVSRGVMMGGDASDVW